MRRIVSLPLAVLGFLLYHTFLLRWLKECPETFRQRSVIDSQDELGDTQNSTLGFEKIFAIGFSDRTDKRDAMTMGASFVGIDLDWVEGVTLDSIPEKAYPATWETEREKPVELGCWRAHMDVLQQIVSDRVSSALILEDDADWDITLKSQMLEFARGTRAVQEDKWARSGRKSPATPPGTPSPYGDDWDMLWLGFCGIDSREDERLFYIIPDDPTAPPISRRTDFKHPLLVDNSQMQQARVVFDAVGGVCTAGYAVTYDGARKILAQLSMAPLNEPVDVAYGEMCDYTGADDNFRCLAPYPPLIGTWRQTGSSERDSDIYYTGDEWHEAYSEGIVYSVMLNAQRLANGEETCLTQWEETEHLEIDPSDFVSPRGFLYERQVPEAKPTVSHFEVSFTSPDTLSPLSPAMVSSSPSPSINQN